MMRPWPRTLTGQLVVAMLAVALVAQVANFYLLVGEQRLANRSQQYGEAIERTARILARLDVETITQTPLRVSRGPAGSGIFIVSANNRASVFSSAIRMRDIEEKLAERLLAAQLAFEAVEIRRVPFEGINRREASQAFERATGQELFHPRRPPDPQGPRRPGMEEMIISVQISPTLWLNGMLPHYPADTITLRAAIGTVLMLVLSGGAIWLLSRRITRPMRDLADAADRLGRGQSSAPLDEAGPADTRRAAEAFNQMQTRLTRLLDTQQTMLRAIGHDLRTPLTALRIRAEDLPAEHGREKIISTLDEMKQMTEEILGWAKDASAVEAVASVDMAAMVESIVDDYADQRQAVTFHDHGQVVGECRRVALRRATRNLIDNALKYGESASVTVLAVGDDVEIRIADKGPGIPAGQLDAVKQPFVRLEGSRSRETGGTGLGLSIVNTVIEAHGGELRLKNMSTGGLEATLVVPQPRDTASSTD